MPRIIPERRQKMGACLFFETAKPPSRAERDLLSFRGRWCADSARVVPGVPMAPSMKRACRWVRCGWLVILVAAVQGCRFRGWEGPVPRSLVLSRQLSQQGQTALERRNWQRAEQLLAQAVKTFPQDAEARRHFAEALWQGGKQTEALDQMRQAMRLAPDDPQLLVRATEMRLIHGDAAEAARLVEHALDVDPKNARVWALRGKLREQSGDLRAALADFQRALSYRADDREALLSVAEAYRRLNEPQRALAGLQNLAETYPPGEEPPQVLYLIGLAFSAEGRYGDAVDSLSAARDRGPVSPELLFRLADAQWRAGRAAEAQQTAARALALDPRHAGSQQLLRRMAQAPGGVPSLR